MTSTSSAATLLVENINSASLLEIQGSNSIRCSVFQKVKLKDRNGWLPKSKTYLLVIIKIMKCVASKEK